MDSISTGEVVRLTEIPIKRIYERLDKDRAVPGYRTPPKQARRRFAERQVVALWLFDDVATATGSRAAARAVVREYQRMVRVEDAPPIDYALIKIHGAGKTDIYWIEPRGNGRREAQRLLANNGPMTMVPVFAIRFQTRHFFSTGKRFDGFTDAEIANMFDDSIEPIGIELEEDTEVKNG